MNYPYTLKTDSLKSALSKIKTTGVPDKFTQKHLESIGFTSKNDRKIIGILKFISFLDSAGTPADSYRQYRGADSKKVLGKAIKIGYHDLFTIHSDAQNKDDETLRHFFATKTSSGDRVLKATVATFKTLSSNADFEDLNTFSPVEDDEEQIFSKPPEVVDDKKIVVAKSPSININIELQLPESDDPKVYDNFFRAMKEHLLKNE